MPSEAQRNPGNGFRGTLDRFGAYFTVHPVVTFFVTLVLLGVVVLVPLGVEPAPGHDVTTLSYVLAVADSVLILFVLSFALRNGQSKLSKLVVGLDERTSTSKTTYIMWTAGVAFALAYILNRTLFTQESFACVLPGKTNCVPAGTTWEQYLILLGVPAAAVIVAKGIATSKDLSGSIQQISSGSPSLSDLTTDGTGQTDIADAQYLVFNVIAFVYFLVNFFETGTFASVPAMLLGLTSASAAAYTTNKALIDSKPVIRSVTPRTITPGDTVTVTGANLFPDPTDRTVRVSIDGAHIQGDPPVAARNVSNSDTVTFIAPPGMTPGQSEVSLVTSAGLETNHYIVRIDQAMIVGWKGQVPTVGSVAVLSVSSLPNVDPKFFSILIAGLAVDPLAVDPLAGLVTLRLPASVRGDVAVTILVDGQRITVEKTLAIA